MECATTSQNFLRAAEKGDIALIKHLLSTGLVNVQIADEQGRTALHFAVAHGLIDLVKLLIQSNANVSATDVRGNSPLHLASLGNKPSIVSLLLQSGVNPNQTDSLGKTPIDWIVDRIRHMRGAIYHRRLQYADEEEIIQIRHKLLSELQGMINDITQWTQTGGADQNGLVSQLQTVADKMNESDSLDLDELDSLFNSLSV